MKPTSWETTTTVRRSLRCFSRSKISISTRWSMFAVGSSSSSTSGSETSARATSTRCICPPDRVPMGRSASPATSVSRMASAASARSRAVNPPNGRVRPSRPRATQSRTEMGKSREKEGYCGT